MTRWLKRIISYKDRFVDNSFNTNIFIACFTTSSTRLMLCDKLDYLSDQVLYFDIDSIMYVDRPGRKKIQTGDMLGEMSDELNGRVIKGTFASGGLKNYSFVCSDNESKCTIKGFHLNYENRELLNHQSMLKIIKNEVNENKSDMEPKDREIVIIDGIKFVITQRIKPL